MTEQALIVGVLLGIILGASTFALVVSIATIAGHRRLRGLPPATSRQIARAGRAARLQLAHSDRRNWLPEAAATFDHEET